MLCCTGPPLPDALNLLAPLVYLEELSLRGSDLGGAIPPDVVGFNSLKKLNLASMSLDGKPLGTRAELHDRLASKLTLLHRRYPYRAGAVGKIDLPRCGGQ